MHILLMNKLVWILPEKSPRADLTARGVKLLFNCLFRLPFIINGQNIYLGMRAYQERTQQMSESPQHQQPVIMLIALN
jgi:hypothetical protein